MTKSGVLYLVSGSRHLAVLAVSLWSLRKHWQSPIHIAVGDRAAEIIVCQAAADRRLSGSEENLTWSRWKPPAGQRGSAYFAKTFMFELSPFERTIFLDADTLVCAGVESLIVSPLHAVTLTQFANWTTRGRRIQGRIRRFREASPADADEMFAREYPAINTGVMAFDKSKAAEDFFRDWKATAAKRIEFICDELACQLIFWRHSVRVLDDRWNYSPIHSRSARENEAHPAIYHFHGKKHVRRPEGLRLWLPAFQQCWRQNIAGIAHWAPSGDRYLADLLRQRPEILAPEIA